VTLAAISLAGGVLWSGLRPPRIVPHPERDLVIADVTVLEPGTAPLPSRTVSVRGGEIASIEPFRGMPPEAEPDLAGAYLLPGLIDLHVHHPPAVAVGERALFGLLFLAHGVTSVRDTGSFRGSALALAEEIRSAAHVAPRVFACGAVMSGPRSTFPGARTVTDAAEAGQAVAELREAGARCVKLHNGLSREAVEGLRKAAQEAHLPVVAHVPASVLVRDLGGAEVQHLMGAKADWSELDPGDVDLYVRTSVERGISHTPTLVVFAELARRASGEVSPMAGSARILPRYYREILWNPQYSPIVKMLRAPGGPDPRHRISGMQDLALALRRAGVPIHVGTDTPSPGASRRPRRGRPRPGRPRRRCASRGSA
jgi:hypothetical protein